MFLRLEDLIYSPYHRQPGKFVDAKVFTVALDATILKVKTAKNELQMMDPFGQKVVGRHPFEFHIEQMYDVTDELERFRINAGHGSVYPGEPETWGEGPRVFVRFNESIIEDLFRVYGFICAEHDIVPKKIYAMGKNVERTFAMESSNGKKSYEILLYENGTLSCNCPGWRFRKECRHTKEIARRVDNEE